MLETQGRPRLIENRKKVTRGRKTAGDVQWRGPWKKKLANQMQKERMGNKSEGRQRTVKRREQST